MMLFCGISGGSTGETIEFSTMVCCTEEHTIVRAVVDPIVSAATTATV
jgi:hypothetical protein